MRKILSLIPVSGIFLASAFPVFAQNTVNSCPTGIFNKLCPPQANSGTISSVVSSVITVLLIAAVVISVVYLIYGGIRWILSGGDKTKLETARSHIVAAIVGLIVAFAAFFIVSIVMQIFFGQSIFSNLTLPSLNLSGQ